LRIAFAAGEHGDLYVVSEDGSGLREIASNQPEVVEPAWSPFGDAIAVSAGRAPGRSIYVMRPDGSRQVKLTGDGATGASGPRWSPDGARIAYTRYSDVSGPDLVVVSADGSDHVDVAASPLNETQPAWSPTGDRIAFIYNNGEIHSVRRSGGPSQRITPRSIAASSGPAWSPDGSLIAFVGGPPDLSEDWLYVIRPDGTGLRRLATASGQQAAPAWSPDGRSIAFVHGGYLGIATIGVDGRGYREITPQGREPSLFDEGPAWSPRGDEIAFVRSGTEGQSEDHVREIWKARADGSGLRRLSRVAGSAVAPISWEPLSDDP
jgi:TolB protein